MHSIPKFLILQSESTLMTFPAKSELPFHLYTTEVCNCLCVVLYSSSQGVAYMGHLDLANMGQQDFDKYISTFNNMIQKHGLNSDNTEIALVGANKTDRTANLVDFNDSTAALRFKEYFEKNFTSSYQVKRNAYPLMCTGALAVKMATSRMK